MAHDALSDEVNFRQSNAHLEFISVDDHPSVWHRTPLSAVPCHAPHCCPCAWCRRLSFAHRPSTIRSRILFVLWTIVQRMSGHCPIRCRHLSSAGPLSCGGRALALSPVMAACVGQRSRDMPRQLLSVPRPRAQQSRVKPSLNICCTLLVYVAGWSSTTPVFPPARDTSTGQPCAACAVSVRPFVPRSVS